MIGTEAGGWIVMEFGAGAFTGVLIGFLCGYGVRALISLRRHAAAERRRRARRRHMILAIPRDAERHRVDEVAPGPRR